MDEQDKPVTEGTFIKLFLEAMNHPDISNIFNTINQPVIDQIREQTEKKIGKMQETINNQNLKIQHLETTVDRLDQESRKNKMIVTGMQVKKTEEENIEIISNFIEVVMQMDIPKEHIISAHGIGKQGKSMLVTLASPAVKEEIFKKKKDLKHQAKMVYINDSLTPSRALLFKQARDLVKSKNISGAWTSQGNILIKEKEHDNPRKINSDRDLEKYLKVVVKPTIKTS